MTEQNPGGLRLPNVRAAYRYLVAQGWKLSERTAYLHRDEGKLKPGHGGTFSTTALERYARRYLRRIDGSGGAAEPDEETGPEEAARIRLRTAQAEHWELRTRISASEYVPRGTFEQALAARAAVLVSDADNWRYACAPAIIDLVHGDHNLLPDLLEYLRSAHETWFARYSEQREFSVPISSDVSLDDLPTGEPSNAQDHPGHEFTDPEDEPGGVDE